MPPPLTNLESILFGGGSDGKVACESFADRSFEVDDAPPSTSFEAPYIAGVYHPGGYDRKASTKGLANPKSGPLAAAARKPRASSSAAAAAAAAGVKPPVLALPAAKIQTAARLPARGRVFPKKRGWRKPAVPEAEPGSPKVDCFGKVLSSRDRERRRPGTADEREARGFWAGPACALRCWGGSAGGEQEAEKEVRIGGRRSLPPWRSFPAEEEEEQPAPIGLARMRAYTSSRRTASWAEAAERVARNPGSDHHT